jgi:hypothetical protein
MVDPVVSGLEWPRLPAGVFAILGTIALLAAGLRLLGITFGLPVVYNPDEVAIMSRALAFATGDLNPHNFLYPTFYFYVLAAWIGASFVVSWLAGLVPSVAAFQTQFFTDPTYIYLAGRLLGVVCGVITVILTYALGARFGGRTAGLIAALFLAVAPTHVRDSHYVKHDVPATLAIVIAQLAILRVLTSEGKPPAAAETLAALPSPQPTRVRVLLAGAACGVAFSTHYYAIFLVVPLALAVYLRERSHGWRTVLSQIAVAGAAAVVVFFALSPYILVEPRTAWQDIVANRQIVIDRAGEAQQRAFASVGAYARMLWTEAAGWPVLVAAIAGLVLAARERWRETLVFMAFPAAFLLFITNTVAAGRYLNPILPTLAALAALAVVHVAGRIAPTRPSRQAVAAWVAAVLLSVPAASLSLRLGMFFRQTDTRTIAQRIIERDIPPGSTVLLQPYSVPLTQSRASLVEALEARLGDPSRASTKFALRLGLEPYPAPAYRTLFLGDGGLDADKIYLSYRQVSGPNGPEALRHAGVQYVVLKRYNVEDPAAVPLRKWLQQHGRLLASVTPYGTLEAAARARIAPFLHNTDTPYHPALERPGPGIEVWQARY